MVVANREPYQHRFAGDSIECIRPASGMATALDPVMRSSGGVWVAHGSGDADRLTVDEHDHVQVPPENPSLYPAPGVADARRLEEGYYHGLPTRGSGPFATSLSLGRISRPALARPTARSTSLFADAVVQEAGDRPTIVFIQDYHFGLLPKYLKDRKPEPDRRSVLAHSLAQPRDLSRLSLEGRAPRRPAGQRPARISPPLPLPEFPRDRRPHDRGPDRPGDLRGDSRGKVNVRSGPSPSASTSSGTRRWPRSPGRERQCSSSADARTWRARFSASASSASTTPREFPERLRAIDRAAGGTPRVPEKLVFVQVGVPSRQHVPQYQQIDNEIDRLVERVNWKWSTGRWKPDRLFQAAFLASRR